LINKGEFDEAKRLLEREQEIRKEIGGLHERVSAILIFAKLHKEKKNYEESLKYIDIAEKLKSPFYEIDVIIRKAEILFLQKNHESAKRLLQKNSENFDKASPQNLFEKNFLSAKIDFALGDTDAKTRLYKMLDNIDDEEKIACLQYELWKIETGTQKREMGEKALNALRTYYRKNPVFYLKAKINELKQAML
jgi:tetratricopeptide (TPR) repeat protein